MVWPTSTPATSVIASNDPVGRMPTFSPKSEARGRVFGRCALSGSGRDHQQHRSGTENLLGHGTAADENETRLPHGEMLLRPKTVADVNRPYYTNNPPVCQGKGETTALARRVLRRGSALPRGLRFLLLRSGFRCRFGAGRAGVRGQHVRQFVCLPKPVSDGRLHLVPVPDLNEVNDLGLRCAIDATHLRGLQRAAKEHADFEEVPLRTHEEVARFAREHDRFVRGVDPLISKRDGSLAQPLPGVLEISREILREGRFGRGPAVVLLPFLDPLLAVVALSTCHSPIVVMQRAQTAMVGNFR